MSYKTRLRNVIPGGAHTYSRGSDQFPQNAPEILVRGEGAYVWDPEGNQYLDYGMALRAVTLGYGYPSVNLAAIRQIENGNNLTRASTIELEAAELLVELVPSIEMVKFGKNGSNVTTAAVKLARAYTGKEFVCIPRQHPFFSFDDWFIGTTAMNKGVAENGATKTLLFDYGDIRSLHQLFDEYKDRIACVMLEPATTVTPCAGACSRELTWDSKCADCPAKRDSFLHQVRDACDKHDSLMILDEMITGFRWHLKGAQHYFGVTPDLTTFGKGMANGFSVAAVGGKREVMEMGSTDIQGAERTFLLSTTHGGEMSGLGAFIETVNVYQKHDVCAHLWNYGANLKKGYEQVVHKHGLSKYVSLEGPDICLNYLTRDEKGEASLEYRTLFSQEMIKNGVLMPWLAVSLSHTDRELELTMNALDKTLEIYGRAISEGVDKYLSGSTIKPVFRKFN